MHQNARFPIGICSIFAWESYLYSSKGRGWTVGGTRGECRPKRDRAYVGTTKKNLISLIQIYFHLLLLYFFLLLFLLLFYFLSDVGRATNLIVAGQIFLTPVTIPFMLRCTQRVFHFESIRSRVLTASIENFYYILSDL